MNQVFHTAVVEDRMDPLMMGRCRVRVVGVHSESKVDLPTENLPWAFPMVPITSASVSGIGDAPVGPVEGSWVIVFFRDEAFQYPIMMGTIPGVPIQSKDIAEYAEKAAQIDTLDPIKNPNVIDNLNGFSDPNGKYPLFFDESDVNRLARHQFVEYTSVRRKLNNRYVKIGIANAKTMKWEQSPTAYNSVYPFNHVMMTESGHIMEFDDTDGAERINIEHRTGSFIEIDNNGSQVNRIVGSGYTIIDNDGLILIKGNCVVNIEGDAAVKVNGSSHLSCNGSINIGANKDINIDSSANISLKSTSSLDIEAKDVRIKSSSFSVTTTNVDMKYSQFAADGKTHFNRGKANPKLPEIIWNNFTRKLRHFFVPNIELQALMENEDLSNDELRAKGIDVESDTLGADPDEESKETSEEELEKSNEPVMPVGCTDIKTPITSSTRLSPNFTVGSFLKPSSGGSIVAQHGLTVEQIACNLKWVAVNVAEPIKRKYPGLIITSGFRRGNGTSQHERGQAMDMQFSDCRTREDYYERCKELIKIVPAIDQIIFEQKGSTTWVHISSKQSGNRGKIASYNGSTYASGLILYGGTSVA